MEKVGVDFQKVPEYATPMIMNQSCEVFLPVKTLRRNAPFLLLVAMLYALPRAQEPKKAHPKSQRSTIATPSMACRLHHS